MSKKMIALLLAVFMGMAIFAGCGTQQAASTSEATTVQGTTAAVTEPSTAPSLKGDFEVQIFVGGYGDTWWKEMIDGFKAENPGLNVIVNMSSQVNKQLATRWMSKDTPDLAFADGDGFTLGPFEEDGKLMDLTAYFDTAKTADGSALIKDKLAPGMLTKYTDGKIYIAPIVFGSLGMFYDAKLFKDNNITPPANFDEFIKLAPVLKEKGIALMDYPGVYSTYLYQGFMQQLFALEGGDQFMADIEAMKPGTFNSPLFVKALTKVETIAKTDNGIMKGTVALNHTQSQMEFLNRKAAFIPNGLWLENEMKNDLPADFEMSFIPTLIQDPGQKYAVCPYSAGVVVSKDAKNPDAAMAFISYVYKDANAARFTELTGTPTAFVADLTNAKVSTVAKSVAKWLADPNVIAVTPKMPGELASKALNDGINAIVLGQKTAQQVAGEIEAAAAKDVAEKAAKTE